MFKIDIITLWTSSQPAGPKLCWNISSQTTISLTTTKSYLHKKLQTPLSLPSKILSKKLDLSNINIPKNYFQGSRLFIVCSKMGLFWLTICSFWRNVRNFITTSLRHKSRFRIRGFRLCITICTETMWMKKKANLFWGKLKF